MGGREERDIERGGGRENEHFRMRPGEGVHLAICLTSGQQKGSGQRD